VPEYEVSNTVSSPSRIWSTRRKTLPLSLSGKMYEPWIRHTLRRALSNMPSAPQPGDPIWSADPAEASRAPLFRTSRADPRAFSTSRDLKAVPKSVWHRLITTVRKPAAKEERRVFTNGERLERPFGASGTVLFTGGPDRL
jgi:hypothetical protein